jgi:hypothetical protein
MLDRLPVEVVRMIESYIPNVHNGISLRTSFSDFRHRLVVRVDLQDKVRGKILMTFLRAAISTTPDTVVDTMVTYYSETEFDMIHILLNTRLPPRTHVCNWCYSDDMVSFGIAQTNTSFRLACSHTAQALTK